MPITKKATWKLSKFWLGDQVYLAYYDATTSVVRHVPHVSDRVMKRLVHAPPPGVLLAANLRHNYLIEYYTINDSYRIVRAVYVNGVRTWPMCTGLKWLKVEGV